MAAPVALWQQTAEAFDQRLSAVTDAQWTAATPCTEWTVRQLVDHAVGVQTMLGGVLGGDAKPDADWASTRAALAAALADPAVLDGEIDHPALGKMSRQQVLGIAITDLLLHTWDLARATGGDENLPPAVVEVAYHGLQQLPPAMMRAPGRFDAEVEVAADADLQTRMLAFSGRRP